MDTLPPPALTADIDRLHLDRASRKALRSNEINSIGELAGPGYVVPHAWEALGRANGKKASAAIQELSAFASPAGVDWDGFWRQRGVRLVPEEATKSATVRTLLAAAPELFRAALAERARSDEMADRDWVILDGRNGLVSRPMTLHELGSGALRLTRERVRQLEVKAMTRLREAWTDGFHDESYRLHPSLEPAMSQIVSSAPTVGHPVFQDDLAVSLGLDAAVSDRDLRRLGLLLELAGAAKVEADGERRPAVWVLTTDASARGWIRCADEAGWLLTDEVPEAMSETEIAVAMNRRRRTKKVTSADVGSAMGLCRVAERLEDGRWQGRFEYLNGRGNQAHRIISEAGRPVELRTMVKEINARSHGKRVYVRNLAGQLSGDARFVPIGRSGEWGLRAIHSNDAAPIVEMMIEVLLRAGQPLRRDDIYRAIKARRSVAEASVSMYLEFRPEFTKLKDRTWALSEWPEATSRTRRRRTQTRPEAD